MPIKENQIVDGNIQKQTLPGGKYVVMHAELKEPKDYGTAWQELVAWVKENKLEIDISRPSYELYLMIQTHIHKSTTL